MLLRGLSSKKEANKIAKKKSEKTQKPKSKGQSIE